MTTTTTATTYQAVCNVCRTLTLWRLVGRVIGAQLFRCDRCGCHKIYPVR